MECTHQTFVTMCCDEERTIRIRVHPWQHRLRSWRKFKMRLAGRRNLTPTSALLAPKHKWKPHTSKLTIDSMHLGVSHQWILSDRQTDVVLGTISVGMPVYWQKAAQKSNADRKLLAGWAVNLAFILFSLLVLDILISHRQQTEFRNISFYDS